MQAVIWTQDSTNLMYSAIWASTCLDRRQLGCTAGRNLAVPARRYSLMKLGFQRHLATLGQFKANRFPETVWSCKLAKRPPEIALGFGPPW
jgi:hypothetical protein